MDCTVSEWKRALFALQSSPTVPISNILPISLFTCIKLTNFLEKLKQEIPDAVCNGLSGDLEKSTYTLANVRLPFDKQKGLMLLFHLDMKGIACSKGSACQSGSSQGSHVLNEILEWEEQEKPSLRFSFSMYNTREEIDYTVQVLKEFANS